MGCYVCGFTAYCTHGIAVVAVIKEDGGVLVQGLELFGCTGATAVVVYTFAYGEILVAAADYSAECYCSDN